MHPDWTSQQIRDYSENHLIFNDSALGEVLFGDSQYPGRDYRGRGLLHMTWLVTYKEYKQASGIDVVTDPKKLEIEPDVGVDSSMWFWSTRGINSFSDANNVKKITRAINPALMDFMRRKDAAKRAFEVLNKGLQPCKPDWTSTLTVGNGW
ncbi:glycoside hydrolase family 19 protein [Paraburkholderia atlantica]|uniref:glycoside hydrolase family 19 protein n=1 Tax=Paraburkholderia atlantica TaxID=2654982 RepID=UPI0021A3E169|nr:glycoside hydrolase family 19 protein [Paraburkholderia atlantica]